MNVKYTFLQLYRRGKTPDVESVMYLVSMRSRLSLILFFLAYILSFVDRQIVAVLGVQIRDAFSLDNVQIGLLYGSAFSVMYALAGIPMGWLADRISRKWMIVTGILGWSLMTMWSGWATSISMLITARMLLGVSQAMLSPAVYSFLAVHYSASQRATIFSIYASGIFIGVGLSFLAGGTIGQLYDWQTAMIAVAWPGFIVAALIVFLVHEPARTLPNSSIIVKMDVSYGPWLSSAKRMFRNRSIFLHMTGFSLLACTGYTLLAFISILFQDVYQRSDLTPSFGWFFFGVALMVILSGKLADLLARHKPSRRYWMGIVSAAALPLYVIALKSSDAGTAFWFLGLGVLIGSSYNGVATAILHDYIADDQRGFITGLYLFVVSIAGFGLGPPLAGFLMDTVFEGPQAVQNSLIALITVCNLLAMVFFFIAEKRHESDAVR